MKKRFLPILLVASPAVLAAQQTSAPDPIVQTLPDKGQTGTETQQADSTGTRPDTGSTIPDPGSTVPEEPPQPGYDPVLEQFKADFDTGRLWIQAGGSTQIRYDIALDELHIGSRSISSPQSIDPLPTGDAILDESQARAHATGEQVYLVVYPYRAERNLVERRLVTKKVLAMVEPGVNDVDVGIAAGAIRGEHYEFAPEYVVYYFKDGASALRGAAKLAAHPGVFYVEPALARWNVGHSSQPSDKFYDANYSNPLRYPYPAGNAGKTVYQWYLENTAKNGELPMSVRAGPVGFGPVGLFCDIKVRNAWDVTFGDGVKIAFMDQGLEKYTSSTLAADRTIAHVDLTHSIINNDFSHYDFIDDTPDPSPPKNSLANAYHGTAVAGLAAAAINNTSGNPARLTDGTYGGSGREMVGVAPKAESIALRIIEGFIDEVEIAQAFNWNTETFRDRNAVIDQKRLPDGTIYPDVKLSGYPSYDVASHAWGPGTSGPSPIFYGRFLMQASRFILTKNRQLTRGLGPIMVIGGFNDGDLHGDHNLSDFASSGMGIVVGSVTDFGRRVGYSPRGANLGIVTPSSGTFSAVPDEIVVNTEPRITSTSPAPLPVPAYIEYPANVNQVPVTWAQNPVPVTLKFNGTTPLRRPGQQVVTLANTNKYVVDFEGTSASTGLVTGAAALMLATNPMLDWQEVQEIMMRSAEVNQAPLWWDAYSLELENDWMPSNAAHPITHKYGFGVLNTERALLWSKAWRMRADLKPTDGSTSSGRTTARYTGDAGTEEGTPPFRYRDQTLNQYLIIAHRARLGTGQPIGSNKVFQLEPPPLNFRVEHVLVRVHAPSNNASMNRRDQIGIRLIAPPDGPGKPTVISHLHVPKLEDTGEGFNHYRFSSVRHWGTQYKDSQYRKKWLLQFWGGGVNDKISSDHGINITYWGSYATRADNMPPSVEGAQQNVPLKQAVPMKPVGINVYRQPATSSTPAMWKNGGTLKVWFGGFLNNFDPEKDSAEDYPLDNPADETSPRRTRSPHVLKPNPPPIPARFFPPPFNLVGAGRVPLPEPVMRVKSDGLQIQIAGTGPTAGQTMTLSWDGKTVTFTAVAVPDASGTQVPTKLTTETLFEYTARFAAALAANPVLSNDFAVIDEVSDVAGDYIRLMFQPILNPGQSGVIGAVETMANVTTTSTTRGVFGRYQVGLPIGLSFDVRNGVFSGSPQINGEYEVTVYATNLFDWAPAPLRPRLTAPAGYPDAPPELITPGTPLSIVFRVSQTGWTWNTFLQTYFTGAQQQDPNIAGPYADPDFDGISNAYEFVAGTNPLVADSNDPTEFIVPYGVLTNETGLTLFWQVDTTAFGASMVLETSTDLENPVWTPVDSPEPTTVGAFLNYQLTIPAVVGERRFYRLSPRILDVVPPPAP